MSEFWIRKKKNLGSSRNYNFYHTNFTTTTVCVCELCVNALFKMATDNFQVIQNWTNLDKIKNVKKNDFFVSARRRCKSRSEECAFNGRRNRPFLFRVCFEKVIYVWKIMTFVQFSEVLLFACRDNNSCWKNVICYHDSARVRIKLIRVFSFVICCMFDIRISVIRTRWN